MKNVRRLVVIGLAALGWCLTPGEAAAQAGRAYVAEDRGCAGAHRNACVSGNGGDPRRVGGMNDAPGPEVDVVVAGDGDGNLGHGLTSGGSGRDIRAVGAGNGQAVWGFRDYRDNFVYSPLPELASPLEGFQVTRSEAWAVNGAWAAVGSTFFFSDSDPSALPYPTLWGLPGANFTATRLRTALFPPDHVLFPGQPKPGTARDINEAGTAVGSQDGRACTFRTGQDPLLLTPPKGVTFREITGIANDGGITGAGRYNVGTTVDPEYQDRAFVRPPPSVPGFPAMTRIPLPRSIFNGSRAHAINSAGLAVGAVLQANGGTIAALWDIDGRPAPLNNNVDRTGLVAQMQAQPGMADVTAVFLTEAIDVNDSGEILVLGKVTREPEGQPARTEVRAFVLTPTGDPISFSPYTY